MDAAACREVASNPRRSRWVIRALIALFFASGATSLIYEVLWMRQLHLVFGTSQLAVSTVLSAFMAGLALGALIAGRWADRIARPLLWYAALEALIGLYALLFPSLVELVTPVYLGFWRLVEPGPTLFGGVQFALLGALLLPPTAAMGATLPLLVRFVTRDERETGFQVGRLYGANTLGAVAGTAVAGFALLPLLGLTATSRWVAAANLLLACVACLLSWGNSMRGGDVPCGGADEPPRRTPPALLFVSAAAGFSALLSEVAWFRLMTLTLGGSVYAFSIMLLAFLAGIGAGGWIGGWLADRFHDRGRSAAVLKLLVGLQLGVALLSWSAMFAYGELPFAFLWLFHTLEKAPGWLWPARLLLALAIMCPPALLMGATFPCLVRVAAGAAGNLNRPVGQIYGVNTLGAIAGAAAGGLFLLPALHVRGAMLVAISLSLLAALVAAGAALEASGKRRRGLLTGWTIVLVGVIGLLHWRKPPWDPILMTSATYMYAATIDEADRTRQGLIDVAVKPYELLFYDEGLSSVVTVARQPENGNIWLANNGKVDASLEDLETQVLLAHLPFAFRPDAKRVLVIGLASGITTGSVTLYDSPERIDVVELEPAVVAASHEFDAHNRRPLEEPRVRLIVNDGRNQLLLTADGFYDLVSSEPSNPWVSGVSNLFTSEFFELGKRKLRQGGVWAQWFHTYDMGPDDVRSLLGSFADTYRHVRLFRLDDADLVLIGSDSPLSLRVADLQRIFDASEEVVADLKAVGVERVEDILGLYQFGRERMLDLAHSVERNTDDNMRIEYSAPLRLFDRTEDANSAMLQDAAEFPADAVRSKDEILALARRYADVDVTWKRALAALAHAAALNPGDPAVAELYAEFEARREEE